MYQYFKSAFFVTALVSGSLFQSASAAVTHAPLPYVKALHVNPQSFSVGISQNENEEKIQFTILNPTGRALRCTLKDPDGSTLETVYIKARSRETKRNYIFTSADEGVYTIEVTDGKEKIVKKIDLRRTRVIAKTQLTIR